MNVYFIFKYFNICYVSVLINPSINKETFKIFFFLEDAIFQFK